ncbi:chemoreceptor glutamine deamidase CheD [Salinibacillus aidingensis]|uniref:Probable chemoreceptor glutamine deamidase CheD n=1 Tax=Salinibacillus aidingensis TaxID=237684 RepID=A0ABP3L915_9BACI
METAGEIVKVGIADIGILKGPGKIRTSGLGSCVGVLIYDLREQLAALVHIMLPDSSSFRGDNLNRAKYADTGIREAITLLKQNGARSHYLKAKIAGGAQMFQLSAAQDMMRIGPRNIEAVKQVLSSLRIPLISEEVGGSNGRTIEFSFVTGMLTIRTVNEGIKEI